MSEPALSVVVPSHDRPLRLRWLLNALEEQDLDHDRFEVLVAHDSSDPETEELLTEHPLAQAGVLRHLTFAPGPGPAAKRNAAWREARAPVVVFTDDDCRPPADWLRRMGEAVERHPGAVVQGTTRPDPDELEVLWASPWGRSQEIDPPTVWAQTCNISYPREVLDRLGGFDETLPVASGEDTDLALRARPLAGAIVGAPEVVTYHAVDDFHLPARLRSTWRWQHLAELARRYPEVREAGFARVFWKREHAAALLAAAGLALSSRDRRALAAAAPWILLHLPPVNAGRRMFARRLIELPGLAAIDAVETAALIRGSIRYRTWFL